MVQFLSIIFFLGFLQFLLGFSKVPVFLFHLVQVQYAVVRLYRIDAYVSGSVNALYGCFLSSHGTGASYVLARGI